jgi:hypothetical protein
MLSTVKTLAGTVVLGLVQTLPVVELLMLVEVVEETTVVMQTVAFPLAGLVAVEQALYITVLQVLLEQPTPAVEEVVVQTIGSLVQVALVS